MAPGHLPGALPLALNIARSMTEPTDLIFRCDGVSATGLGHLNRSMSLAHEFSKRGLECLFVGHYDGDAVRRLNENGFDVEMIHNVSWTSADLHLMSSVAQRRRVRGVVVDSYDVDASYIRAVQDTIAPVLVLDDFQSLDAYPCAGILNFTSRATDFTYPNERVTCLLGPQWFPASPSLQNARTTCVGFKPLASNVLITAGRNDPHDIFLLCLGALASVTTDLVVRVVVPEQYPHLKEVSSYASRFIAGSTVLSQNADLATHLSWADTCLCSAGLTKYEAAYLGIPAGVLAQNDGQAEDALKMESLGMTLFLGSVSAGDTQRLARGLYRLIFDSEYRKRVHGCCSNIIPIDSVRRLADAISQSVFYASTSADRLLAP